MKLSASQAAKETGKSVPTITRAINAGRMSAEVIKGEDGKDKGYLIDPAELFRVFPPVTVKDNDTPALLGHETPNEMGVLRAEIEGLRQRLTDKDDVIDDLRRRLDQESDERRRLVALLTAPKPEPAPVAAAAPRRAWWWFGRANDGRP